MRKKLITAAGVLLALRAAALAQPASQTGSLPPGKAAGSLAQAPDHTMAELVVPHGYPLEEHVVETEDGYILGLFRIPAGGPAGAGSEPRKGAPARKPVAFLQHGVLECSAAWVVNGPNVSLAFVLADAGYDVWLGNSRGNTYSRRHINMMPDDAAFWAFSYDEMALQDLPAELTYVLAKTGQERLSYVGHSQGTTIALALLSSRPDLASQVSLAVLLAPVAFLTHVGSLPIRLLAAMGTDQVFEAVGVKEFLPTSRTMVAAFGTLCMVTPGLCADALDAICGYNAANVNASRLPTILSYSPAGTSVQNMVHWAQDVRQPPGDPRFVHYDYGRDCTTPLGLPRPCNRVHYGQDAPPEYPLGDISTPLAIFSGGKDKLGDPRDVAALDKALAPGTVVYEHQEPTYEHLDFTWGTNAHTVIYPTVLRLLAEYE